MLYQILQQIPDFRRAQARQFQLHVVLLLTIAAIMTGAKSYRDVARFMRTHFKFFKKLLKLKWKHSPSYSTIGNIISGVDYTELEKAFRIHAEKLLELNPSKQISIDGKTLRGSFDNQSGKEAMHMLFVFATESQIVLGHDLVEKEKTNEIPIAQEIIKELAMPDKTITMDAMHCQKKH
jgi:hypothetical protein